MRLAHRAWKGFLFGIPSYAARGVDLHSKRNAVGSSSDALHWTTRDFVLLLRNTSGTPSLQHSEPRTMSAPTFCQG